MSFSEKELSIIGNALDQIDYIRELERQVKRLEDMISRRLKVHSVDIEPSEFGTTKWLNHWIKKGFSVTSTYNEKEELLGFHLNKWLPFNESV